MRRLLSQPILVTDSGIMSNELPTVYLARHGETAWSQSGRHTGSTDLPLTARGRRDARSLGERLKGTRLRQSVRQPVAACRRTCRLAGFGAVAELDHDLVEWDYGEYEGRTRAEIHAVRPDWQLFRDGCPGGESPEQVGGRGPTGW